MVYCGHFNGHIVCVCVCLSDCDCKSLVLSVALSSSSSPGDGHGRDRGLVEAAFSGDARNSGRERSVSARCWCEIFYEHLKGVSN